MYRKRITNASLITLSHICFSWFSNFVLPVWITEIKNSYTGWPIHYQMLLFALCNKIMLENFQKKVKDIMGHTYHLANKVCKDKWVIISLRWYAQKIKEFHNNKCHKQIYKPIFYKKKCTYIITSSYFMSWKKWKITWMFDVPLDRELRWRNLRRQSDSSPDGNAGSMYVLTLHCVCTYCT